MFWVDMGFLGLLGEWISYIPERIDYNNDSDLWRFAADCY